MPDGMRARSRFACYLLLQGIMKTKRILIVSGLDAAQWSFLDANYETSLVNDVETAIELAQRQGFDAVIGDTASDELNPRKLKAIVSILQPETLFYIASGSNEEAVLGGLKNLFDQQKLERVKRYLVLDSSQTAFRQLPAFSLN